MRIVARDVNWERCPEEFAPYTNKSQTFLTIGQEYEVYAVAIFKGLTSLLIVNDVRYPSWEKGWLFDVVDSSVSPDWICSLFHDEPSMVLGPEFIARDEASYGAMVELEADAVDLFWKRVDSLRQQEQSETE